MVLYGFCTVPYICLYMFVQYLMFTLLYHRFLHCSTLWGQEISNIFDEHMGKHYHEHCEMEHTSPNDDKLISHLPSFIENLLHHGEIKWRFYSAEKDICVMSDINPGNGILLPGSFGMSHTSKSLMTP